MPEIIGLTRETAEWLRRESGVGTGALKPRRRKVSIEAPPGAIVFRNDSGETLPAYGVFAATGIELDSQGRWFLNAGKPSTTFRREYFVNGPRDVADEAYGAAQTTEFVRVLYDNAATPTLGQGWGPKASTWKVSKQYPDTASVIGIYEDDETIIARWHEITKVRGQTDDSVTAGGMVDLNLFDGAGNDLSVVLADVIVPYADVGSGKEIGALFVNGQWEAYAAECS